MINRQARVVHSERQVSLNWRQMFPLAGWQTGQLSNQLVNQLKKTTALSMSCLLMACGGGSSDNLTPANAVDVDNASISGTVVLEERNGKTVLDGWFTQGDLELGAAQAAQTIEIDSCVSSSVNTASVGDLVHENGSMTPAWQTGLSAMGDEIKIDSRVGEFESLIEQTHGNTTVYAPENRWQSESQPDDAVLSFDSGSVFGNLNSVEVAPLIPLVWISPESGVLSAAATSLRWEASFNAETLIRLRLSAIDFSDSENPEVITIACQLVDDGLFTLPADFQEELPGEHSGITVYAVRERVQQIIGDESHLTVVQLSHPTPADP